MKQLSRVGRGAVAALALVAAVSGPAMAASSSLHQVGTVKVPGNLSAVFDISWVDPSVNAYFLADHHDAVDVVNTQTGKFEGTIGSGDFAGPSQERTAAQNKACGAHGTGGPNGVMSLSVGGQLQLWAGDGVTAANPTSSVKVFNLTQQSDGNVVASGAPVSISTGGQCRADELAYDATDHIVAIANDVDSPPFLTFISVNADPAKDAVIAKLTFDGNNGNSQAIDGIEQTVWDPTNDVFYINLPQVPSQDGTWTGQVVEVSGASAASGTPTAQVLTTVSGCSPAGLALDVQLQQLLLGCSGDAVAGDSVNGVNYPGNPAESITVDATTGKVLKTFNEVGSSDEVWFNPGNNTYYLAANGMTSNGTSSGWSTPVLGVIQATADGGTWIENFPGGPSAHSVAVDPNNNHVFFPIPKYGVAILAAPSGAGSSSGAGSTSGASSSPSGGSTSTPTSSSGGGSKYTGATY